MANIDPNKARAEAAEKAKADESTSNINQEAIKDPAGLGYTDPETLPVAPVRHVPLQSFETVGSPLPPVALASDEKDPPRFTQVPVIVLQRCYDGGGRELAPGDRTIYSLEEGKSLPSVFERQ